MYLILIHTSKGWNPRGGLISTEGQRLGGLSFKHQRSDCYVLAREATPNV